MGAGQRLRCVTGRNAAKLGLLFSMRILKLDVEYRVIEMQKAGNPMLHQDLVWPLANGRLLIPVVYRIKPVDGARLCGHSDGRGHSTLSEGRGNHATARTIWRSRYRCEARSMTEMASCRRRIGLRGCQLRDCWFEPTFPQTCRQLCNGIQIDTEDARLRSRGRSSHGVSRRSRSRLFAACIPDYQLWRDFAYEYERQQARHRCDQWGPSVREWVDDAAATPQDLDVLALADERLG